MGRGIGPGGVGDAVDTVGMNGYIKQDNKETGCHYSLASVCF